MSTVWLWCGALFDTFAAHVNAGVTAVGVGFGATDVVLAGAGGGVVLVAVDVATLAVAAAPVVAAAIAGDVSVVLGVAVADDGAATAGTVEAMTIDEDAAGAAAPAAEVAGVFA